MSIRLIPALVALACLSGAYATSSAPAQAEDKPAVASSKVVATINGQPIKDGYVTVADGEIGSDMGSLPPDQKRMSLVEFLIDNQLFAEAAEAEKLGESPEFQVRLNYLKRRALRELYFEKIIKSSVADADARAIYDDQVRKLKPEEEVQARHILVASEDEAKALKAKVDKGEDFAKLAKENSKDPGSKDDGGNLGYFGRGQMVPQFEEVVFKLKKGEVSAPVKTQFGWHLVKIEDKRMKQPPAFEIVKDRIVQSLLLQKAQQAATNLRQKAKIEFVDPAIKSAIDTRNKALTAAPAAAEAAAEPAKGDAKPADAAAKPADAAATPADGDKKAEPAAADKKPE